MLLYLSTKSFCKIVPWWFSLRYDNLLLQKSLPPNTLGRVCTDYNEKYNITLDARDPVHFVDDPELAYVMRRYRLLHLFIILFWPKEPWFSG